MTFHRTLARWSWRILACAAALIVGQMIGVALVAVSGLELPQPVASDEGLQALLIIPAALAIAVALAVLATGLSGRWWQRGAVLTAFLYGVYGLGTMIETTIFTTLGGEASLAVLHLPGSVLGPIAAVVLFPTPSSEGFTGRALGFLSRWSPGSLALRLALAVLAFPICYFVFGAMVAPIVTPYYRQLDILVLPALPSILRVVFTRSVLFLLVSLPVIVAWHGSRRSLIVALGLGHFVAVGLAGLILATFFPPTLRWAHGVEILADSMCYAVALGWLLFPRGMQSGLEQAALRERTA